MGLLDRFSQRKPTPNKRKFKVRRGAGARVARAVGLSEGHVSQVINGKREASPTLLDALQHEERIFREGPNE